MATAAVFSSEETFEYKCTALCGKKKIVEEAVKACKECKKYFCTSCLDVHNDMFDDHKTVEPSTLTPQLCKKHAGKMIEIWCVEHDVVGCVSCALFEHRACENLKDIQSNIKEIFKQEEFNSVQTKLKDGFETIKDRQNILVGEKENLLVEKNTQLSKTEQYTQKLISKIKALEKISKDEVNEKFQEIEDTINKAADDCKHHEENLKQCVKHLESCIDNEPQMFITMKTVQQTIRNCQESDVGDFCTVVYKPYSFIEHRINMFHSVGGSSKLSRKNVAEIKQKQEINIEMSDESEEYDIQGSCLLEDGSIVVTDYHNKKLKRVDISSSSVIDTCALNYEPIGVCCIGKKDLVVTLTDSKIQFVTLNKKLTMSRIINVDHVCSGIAYHNGELFVSDEGKNMYVYNRKGSLLRSLSNITQSNSGHVVVSNDGNKVFIVCNSGELVCTDRHGEILYKKTYENIDESYGVCLYDKSSLLICGNYSHNVVQVSESGEEFGEIVNSLNGVRRPTSACYDPSRQRLIVTQESNTVLVFELAFAR